MPRAPVWSPDISALRAFVTLVHEGRFARAAKALGLSPSALSRQIQRLEEELGTTLVVRGPNDVVPTEAGHKLLVHVERLLATLEAARSEIGSLLDTPQGVVTVGAIVSVGAYVLPSILPAFREQHRDVRVVVREGVSDDLEARLSAGELDFAILGQRAKHPDLVMKPLWREEFVVVARRGHPLAALSGPVPLEKLFAEPLILAPGWPLVGLLSALTQGGALKLDALSSTDNLETVRRMVESGSGISFLPRIVLEAAEWNVVPIATTLPPTFREVTLAHRGASHLTAASLALIDAVSQYAAALK
jgi:LysR family transcriptional activator of glutamate synthase operon